MTRQVIKQRNNFSKLSYEARKRILYLLFDGAGYDAIRNDPAVKKCCGERALSLHNTTFQAIRRSKEYADYEASLAETARRTDGAKWAAEILRTAGGLQDIADVTQLALLEQLREITENATSENKIPPEELLKLASAVAKIKDSASGDKNRRLQKQLEQRDAELEAKDRIIADLRKQVDDRNAQIEKLKAIAGTVDNADVIAELDKSVGIA